ncbi:MAG: hypothetical protein V1882_02120 [Candidatus Omnitrophota bacterium]
MISPTKFRTAAFIDQEGFLLLEVITAIAIMSILLITLISGLSQCLKAIHDLSDMCLAEQLTENTVFYLRQGEMPDLVFVGGERIFDGGYRLRSEVVSFSDAINQITFRMEDGKKQKILSTTGLFLMGGGES